MHSKVLMFNTSFVSGKLDDFIDHILNFIKTSKKSIVISPITMNEIKETKNDYRFFSQIKKIDYVTMDGMPIVFLARLKERDLKIERMYGPDMMMRFLKKSTKQFKHYFLGTNNETLKKLQIKIKHEFSNVVLSGSYSPTYGDIAIGEIKEIVKKIDRSKANVIWVALGGEKQINLALQIRKLLKDPKIIFTVGAAFDFISQNKKQAPYILRLLGLEWLFRLINEPKRLWNRYVVQFPFVFRIFFCEFVKILRSQ